MTEHTRNLKENISGLWRGKRYYSLEAFLKNQYGYRMKKVALDAGFTCPNRDGTLDTRGCIFCSAGGSGEFAVSADSMVSAEQIPESGNEPLIAYFQAFTCTYAPAAHLETLYRNALNHPFTAGISIATRPDCLPEEVLTLLGRLKREYTDKFIWIELGLQTIHESTAAYIRRGYALPCFEQAVHALHALSIPVIVHVILGLPGESKSMMLQTIEYLNRFPLFGVKLQLLHVLKGTDLALDYEKQLFQTLTLEEYLDLLISCIERLSPDTVLHRVTGDGAKELLIAPIWSRDKKKVLNALHHRMKLQDSYQGKHWKGSIHYAAETDCHL